MFSLQQNWRKRGQNRICLEARGVRRRERRERASGEKCPKLCIHI
jgi:hypothetical protein